MIIKKNINYNSRIDYMICKNLIKQLPIDFDEYSLRDVFFKKTSPTTSYENDIVCIRNFFETNEDDNIMNIEKLFYIITKEYIDFKYYYVFVNRKVDINYLQDLRTILDINESNNKETIMKICIVFSSIKYDDVPLIPTRSVIRTLIECEEQSKIKNIEKIKLCYKNLLKKKDKYLYKHSLDKNNDAIRYLYEHSKEIVSLLEVLAIGIYGSFATNTCNEYSDLDILIITYNDQNKEKIYQTSYEYLSSKIPIAIDIKVVREKDIDNELTIGMKKSMRLLWRVN